MGTMIDAKAAGRILCVSPRSMYQLAAQGKIRHFRPLPGKVAFAEEDVVAYRDAVMAPAPLIPARTLRTLSKLLKDATAAGGTGLPSLTEEQQAIADLRYRRMVCAPWNDAAAMKAVYAEAASLSSATGTPHHVDHIIPLLGEFVSGLHVHTNLRVIPAIDNLRKRNRFDPC